VRAAEQAGLTDQLACVGAKKKDYAIQLVQNHMNRLGLDVDVEEIAALIESEVHRQFTQPTPVIDNPKTRAELVDKAIEVAVLAAQQGSVQEFARQLNQGIWEQNKECAV
jgi:hypothetical protein